MARLHQRLDGVEPEAVRSPSSLAAFREWLTGLSTALRNPRVSAFGLSLSALVLVAVVAKQQFAPPAVRTCRLLPSQNRSHRRRLPHQRLPYSSCIPTWRFRQAIRLKTLPPPIWKRIRRTTTATTATRRADNSLSYQIKVSAYVFSMSGRAGSPVPFTMQPRKNGGSIRGGSRAGTRRQAGGRAAIFRAAAQAACSAGCSSPRRQAAPCPDRSGRTAITEENGASERELFRRSGNRNYHDGWQYVPAAYLGRYAGRIRREYSAPDNLSGDIMLIAPEQYRYYHRSKNSLDIALWPLTLGASLAARYPPAHRHSRTPDTRACPSHRVVATRA